MTFTLRLVVVFAVVAAVLAVCCWCYYCVKTTEISTGANCDWAGPNLSTGAYCLTQGVLNFSIFDAVCL